MQTEETHKQLDTVEHRVDLCVIGGGLAGICAAVSAARKGISVLLMQDRPVLGGNASSEIRMCIRGAHSTRDSILQETGIVEELALENILRNPNMNFSIWDSVLYGIVHNEKNITLLLNCSCCEAAMADDTIRSVTGWQTTTQQWHKVTATIFADCSGDSILAPLTKAQFRSGREAQAEFNESIAPKQADGYTMGLSCLIQARETPHEVAYTPPAWSKKYKKEDFENRMDVTVSKSWLGSNFWWLELGGTHNTITDTEKTRDALLEAAFGVWDFIKNSGACDAKNWELEWVGFLPGKRESRRYVGDYILTQNDITNCTHFEDTITYGGWSMDDHHPLGFETREKPTIFHPAPSPYAIPYRCLYSKNIANLMFAGRNISTTHSALSSTRVMGTCGMLGHAVGNACALAVHRGLLPRQVYTSALQELQQSLLADDCYLPWVDKVRNRLMAEATVACGHQDMRALTDGIDRRLNGESHLWVGKLEEEIIITLPRAERVKDCLLVFDSDLSRETWAHQTESIRRYPMKCHVYLQEEDVHIPETLIKAYTLWARGDDGNWYVVKQEQNNSQRFVRIALNQAVKEVKLVPHKTWGCNAARIYRMELTTD